MSQSIPEIYPAPPAITDGSIGEAELLELVRNSNNADAHFALGNLYLRSAEREKAISHYEELLKAGDELPQVRANLGIALYFEGHLEKALYQLKRASLTDPTLILPQLYIGRISEALSNISQAISSFEKVLSLSKDNVFALEALAELHDRLGDITESRRYCRLLLQVSPEAIAAQHRLARYSFREGRKDFEEGKFESAFRIWADAYSEFQRPFVADQEISHALAKLVHDYNEADRPDADRIDYCKRYSENPDDVTILYPFVLRHLFAIGLMPEAFEAQEALEAQYQRWQRSLEESGEHPYPHFRFAIIHLYRDELDRAETELQICHDKFPPKKHSAIKLRELFALVRLIRDIHNRREDFLNANRPLDEWQEAGFFNQFQLQAWRDTGLHPAEAGKWMRAGFSPKQSVAWKKRSIPIASAREWLDGGFTDPEEVRLWIRGEFTPEEAVRWNEECPLSLDLIVQSRKVGISEPLLAYRWAQVFTFPFESARWHELGFSPEDAIAWRAVGFLEPLRALEWKKKGHDPLSALRVFNDGEELTESPAKESDDPWND